MFNGHSRKRWLVLLLLIIIGVSIYFNSLGNGFHLDDEHHIVENPYLKSPRFIPAYFTDTRTFSHQFTHVGHYRPLLLVTHAINYYLGGLNPVGYHLVNLSFHIGAAFLVYLIVREMVENGRSKKEEVKNLTSYLLPLASGLIFLVHPFNSEVVNYISARSSVMSGFFYLLAFYCWIRFRQVEGRKLQVEGKDEEVNLLPSTFYMFSLLAFLLGMLTKEILITLPVVLWLYDLYFYPLSSFREHVRHLKDYIPFVILVIIPYILVRTLLTGDILSPGPPVRGFYVNLLTQSKVLIKAIYLLIVPLRLSIEHSIKEVYSLSEPIVLLSILLLMTIWIGAMIIYKYKNINLKVTSFFIWWFFITILPTTIIPLNAMLQENRFYLSGVSFAVILSIGMSKIISLSKLDAHTGRIKGMIFALVPIIIVYSIITVNRNIIWKDDLTLWADAIEKAPDSPRALHNLAFAHERAGMIDQAIREYREVIRLAPSLPWPHFNLGKLYSDSGRMDEAVFEYRMAIKNNPSYYNAYSNLAVVELKRGNTEVSIELFRRAIELKPDNVKSYMGLAAAYLKTGENELAADVFEQAAKIAMMFPGYEGSAKEALRIAAKLRRRGTSQKGISRRKSEDVQ